MKRTVHTLVASLVIGSGVAPAAQQEAPMPQTQVDQMLAAIRAGNQTSVEQLLNVNPALMTATAPNGVSAILWSVYTGHPELASVFVSRGARLDLWDASATGDLARVRELIAAKPSTVNAVAPDGFFPLGLAVFFGHDDIVEWLLDHGANVNQPASNPQRVTALHGAVARSNLALAMLLLERGANPNVRQMTGLTPLHEAAANGKMDLVRLLVDRHADTDAKTDEGRTAADFATERGHADVAAWLKSVRAR